VKEQLRKWIDQLQERINMSSTPFDDPNEKLPDDTAPETEEDTEDTEEETEE